MTIEPSRLRRNVRAFLAPVVAVAALAGLVAMRFNTNTELAQSARDGARSACEAVHDSNVTTVDFLTTTFVPAPGSPRYVEAKTFVDGLSAGYERVYDDCLAGIR